MSMSSVPCNSSIRLDGVRDIILEDILPKIVPAGKTFDSETCFKPLVQGLMLTSYARSGLLLVRTLCLDTMPG